MARRKVRIEEEENLDRWLVSYADFITLLFAFFVVMYAISSLNVGKYKEVSSSLIAAFKTVPRSLEPIQVGEVSRDNQNDAINVSTGKSGENGKNEKDGTAPDGTASTDAKPNAFRDKANQIESKMMDLISLDEVTLRRSDKWLEVEINTRILFSSGEAQMVNTAVPVLSKIAEILAPYPNPINVEGFTDNIPINTDEFRSNWELSAARAASVVHLFSQAGVEPSRMSAIAYGEFRPIANNSTVKGRLANRRVVIAILADDIEPDNRKDKNNEQPHVLNKLKQNKANSNNHSQSIDPSKKQPINSGAISF